MKLATLQAFFGDVNSLAVWDIAINRAYLVRNVLPDSIIVNHALFLYLYQCQRTSGSMDVDPRMPAVDLRDFAWDGYEQSRTFWYHHQYGHITVRVDDFGQPELEFLPDLFG